jgi:hypothetical protein
MRLEGKPDIEILRNAFKWNVIKMWQDQNKGNFIIKWKSMKNKQTKILKYKYVLTKNSIYNLSSILDRIKKPIMFGRITIYKIS